MGRRADLIVLIHAGPRPSGSTRASQPHTLPLVSRTPGRARHMARLSLIALIALIAFWQGFEISVDFLRFSVNVVAYIVRNTLGG